MLLLLLVVFLFFCLWNSIQDFELEPGCPAAPARARAFKQHSASARARLYFFPSAPLHGDMVPRSSAREGGPGGRPTKAWIKG